MTKSLHAHVSTAASDCDGPIYRDYVTAMNEAEIAQTEKEYNDFHDIEFRERVLASMMSLSGMGGTLTTRTPENGGWVERAEWFENTDEGYRRAEVIFCEDEDCDPNASSYRDIYAEQMGY